jgi:hypothetical protein
MSMWQWESINESFAGSDTGVAACRAEPDALRRG